MQQSTLEQARAGDERAFDTLTHPYRRELQVHCYRMLGSLTDAEDLLQETLLAAWRGLAGFEERASLRTWLYRIATNRCLNAMRDAARRSPTEPTPPFQPPEPSRRLEVSWLQPYPDALLDGVAEPTPGPASRHQLTESVELAFIVALQRLPPRQTAALVLRDVLGFPTDEVASMLDTTAAGVKGALQRARVALAQNRSQDPADQLADDRGEARHTPVAERDLAQRFAAAYTAADVDGVVALLTDDAWLSMPPAHHEYHGATAIASFLKASFDHRGEWLAQLEPTRANTQPAFGSYLTDPATGGAITAGLIVLTLAGDGISAVTRFHVDELYPRFALPAGPGTAPEPTAYLLG